CGRPAPAFLGRLSGGFGIVSALPLAGRPSTWAGPPSRRRPGALNLPHRCRNINLPSIGYACRPRLRVRLTLGGFTFPRKPYAFGDRVPILFLRSSFRHARFPSAWCPPPAPLRLGVQRSPTAPWREPAASVPRLVPFIIGAGLLDE